MNKNNFKKKNTINFFICKYKNINKDKLKELNVLINISGRIISKRIIGKISFLNLQDFSGKIQIYIKYNIFKKNLYKIKLKEIKLGDIISVFGILYRTKTNELSIKCKKIFILTKPFKFLPNKFGILNNFKNKENKYRKRYLDLIIDNKSLKTFINRSKIIYYIRYFMFKNKFIEVETPIMQNIPGGATAKPFITYHNSLNKNLYLRISPELYLKRLIIGGFEKIFEISKNFRNENISRIHNPEFTMMELYIAYSNYKDLFVFIRNIFIFLIKKINKKYIIKFNKYKINFKKKFDILSLNNSIIKYCPEIKKKNFKSKDFNNIKKVIKISNFLKVKIKKKWSINKIIIEIFKNKVEKKIIQPTFITKYPIEFSPLSKRNNKNINLSDRFELFICGMEIANGFSELTNVKDQKYRFKKQINKNKNLFYDKEYIEALKYGLPPTSGLGIGIDRLIMIITNNFNIKDVILFPILKDK